MNYLAHFYLSDYNENLIIGNYIADDVKGKRYLDYAPKIQEGIILHRKIDAFTDSHEVVLNSKNLIRHHQRKYTPVVIDIFYDYFLATEWSLHSNVNLSDFTSFIYKILFTNISKLPLKSQARLPFMAKSDWLYNYRKIEGISKSLKGLSKRSNYDNNMSNAHKILLKEELILKQDFKQFFFELKEYVAIEIKKGAKK